MDKNTGASDLTGADGRAGRDAASIPAAPGNRRADLVAFGVVAAALSVSMVIQATSIHMDAARDGLSLDGRTPWLLEGSSHVVWLVLATLFPFVLNRAPLGGESVGRTLAVHALAAIAFSLLHVVGMFALREALFPTILGRPYELDLFSAETFIYEFRKDAFTYALFLLGFWSIRMAHDRISAPLAPPLREDRRITIHCGKHAIFLDAGDIAYAKSAGNYVEVTTAAKTHLGRMTLAQLESSLAEAGAPHVRVHRSYLVNPGEIREISPNGEGGVTIELKSGVTIPGSRSYRDGLESALALRAATS